jgi:iron(III) transport system ATP-binding protein
MALCFKNISYSYDKLDVLKDLSLEAKSGQITCLLGPSGGGKSTLLHLAAGIEPIQRGSIEVNGQLIASPDVHLPPEQRPVGLMFQESALFPHMSVEKNVAYGISGLSKSERDRRVASLLSMVGLEGYAQRYPHELSGGQQQRIALVRSLAPEPSVLLMDEPYASIDITLRRSLREAARATLKQSGTTSVMVTHDPSEALEMADTIAVLDRGCIVQVGSPKELFEQPATVSVAALFGDAQVIPAEKSGHHFLTDYGKISCSAAYAQLHDETKCELVVRPSGLKVKKDIQSSLIVADLRYVGGDWLAFLIQKESPPAIPALRVVIEGSVNIGDSVSLSAGSAGFFVY